VGNLDADPVFVDPNTDFHLKSMSPAIEAGPLGLDMGAHVPAGAAICGEPDQITYRTDATLTVGGPGITDYKYCINDSNGPWIGEFSVDTPIVLNGLTDGQSYTVYAIGKNSAGEWRQSQDNAAVSRTWTVDTSHWRLVISEVLARNVEAVDHNGSMLMTIPSPRAFIWASGSTARARTFTSTTARPLVASCSIRSSSVFRFPICPLVVLATTVDGR
jgi:hypothetical protein